MNDLSHLGTAGLHKFPFIAQSKVFSWSIRGNQRGAYEVGAYNRKNDLWVVKMTVNFNQTHPNGGQLNYSPEGKY